MIIKNIGLLELYVSNLILSSKKLNDLEERKNKNFLKVDFQRVGYF